MRIGYACTPLGVSYKTTRKFLLKNLNYDNFYKTSKSNLDDLKKILIYNSKNNIYLFRISSDIIPFGSHKNNTFDFEALFKEDFKDLRSIIEKSNTRLSMHPGQYTIINSLDKNIVKNSIRDLEYHCKFLDALNLDSSSKIILHVGGVYNDKEASINRFIDNYKSLSSNIKKRLVIENDEKNFNISDLLKISEKIDIPIVFDNLHYACFEKSNPNPIKVLNEIKSTWKKDSLNIKVHYSEQDPFKRIGSHSKTINTNSFLSYLNAISSLDYDIDIMTEVKDKDFSSIKLINLLKNDNSLIDSEIDRYKLFLIEKGNSIYDNALKKASISLKDFYNYLDSIFYEEGDLNSFKEALNLAYLNLSPYLKPSEINHYNKYLKSNDYYKAKKYLISLSLKKEVQSLLSLYYFHPF